MDNLDGLRQKLSQLPDSSGVYMYFDANGNVLYVGKAKVLKNRVRQYFASTLDNIKVAKLMSHVADFKYVITPSETDALSLENTLIKKHNPPYNILLKDDKQYPFIKIDVRSAFPRVCITRKILNDGAKYFGPIMGSSRDFLTLIQDTFPLVSCKVKVEKTATSYRPCLNYHLGRCLAPCAKLVDSSEYKKVVNDCISFLNGDDKQIRQTITDKMLAASATLNFEKAQIYKQQLAQLDRLSQSRIVALNKLVDYDIMAISSDGINSVVNVMLIRKGKVTLSDNYSVDDAGIDELQTLSSFISMYYTNMPLGAKELLLNVDLPDKAEIAKFLSQKLSHKMTINCLQRGVKSQLVTMATDNAHDYLVKNRQKADSEYNATFGAMEQLKEVLHLKTLPMRIECFDISNISGVDKVASMVVFTNGRMDNNSYRRYKIQTVEGANDFASMGEVLSRRLKRIVEEDYEFGARPDLIVVDGGLGQLSYGQQALADSGLDISMAALAEKEELIYLPHSQAPIRLPHSSWGLKLLINIRDEAHRFAITYFRNLHQKNVLSSELSTIEGVGDKRQKLLVKHFKDIDGIKNATVDELTSVEGINTKVANNIVKYFNNKY